MTAPDIRGLCPERFERVRHAFEANFAEGLELGARFALAIEGEIVIDLIGGFADRGRTRPFTDDTLTAGFSTTKAMASLMIARLEDAGGLDYDQTMAHLWPEFAAARKGAVSRGPALSHPGGMGRFAQPT